MSLSTAFTHVILGLPTPLLPSITISILLLTQSSLSFLSTWPIHLNLLRLITSSISLIPRLFLSSALVFLSLSDTPHIHLTILISALLSLATCSVFAAKVSLPIVLHTHATYTLLNATFLFVNTPDNSLNFFQPLLTLLIDAMLEPPSPFSTSPR